jgi:DNA-binding CsgD family transcriptional regulator
MRVVATPFDPSMRCPIVIGRNTQLTVLARAFEQVGAGCGQTILVAGEAGIGKSRLVAEAKTMANRQGWRVVEGHCSEPDRVQPYAPLLDLLRALLSGLSSAEVVALFGAEARDLVKILPELARWVDDLQPLLGLDPAQERSLAMQAFTTVMLRLSTPRPVLAIVEDLHWSDDTSLDALLHLARRIAGRPFLLVLTYRDDEIGSELRHFLAAFDRERLATELVLRRLDATQVGTMVDAIVGTTRPARAGLRRELHALTDGNPFFIEEVLNALFWSAATEPGSAARETLALDARFVPRSVQDAVYRRVERLSPDARHVLQLASVAGRRCDFSTLQALTGYEEPALLRFLKELIAAHLLVEEAEDRFAFRHALTQNAVSAQLLSRERRRLHQVIAETHEQLHDEERDRYLADLAYHCYEAGDWRRALAYASQAGEQAMALYAPQAAIEQFSRALDAAQRLSSAPPPALYRARGRARETVGDFAGALADYESSLAAARAARDQRAEWHALLDLGLLWAGRDYEQTAEYCQRALSLARTMADPVLLAQSLNRVGNWYTNIARPREGIALHREALGIVEASGDNRAIAETLDLLGVASYVAGSYQDSAAYCAAAIERFAELDDRQGLASCLGVLAPCGGSFQTDAGVTAAIPLDECVQHAERAISLAQEIGWRPGEAFAQHGCALVHTAAGHYDRAFAVLAGCISLSEEIGHRQWATAGKCDLGALYLELLDVRRARQYLERAIADARGIGSRVWVLTVSAPLATACLLEGDLEAAQTVLDGAILPDVEASCQGVRNCRLALAHLQLARENAAEALRIADDLIATDPHLTAEREAPCLARLRGEALAKLGRLEEAEVALRAAVDGADELGRPGHSWRARVALGRVLRMQRRHAEGDAVFADARETIGALAASVPDQAVRQTFLSNTRALLPRPRQPTARQAAAQAYGGLTEREREVAALIARGLSNRAIAERLIVSEPTVATHVSHVLAKLGVRSRAQVATWALEVGLLAIPDIERWAEKSTARAPKDHQS